MLTKWQKEHKQIKISKFEKKVQDRKTLRGYFNKLKMNYKHNKKSQKKV